ncbi:MAG: hypothetical protein MI748_11555 [Opitutales bacterium]|nr:hypothetical protein [Opitutales bacterium]
MKKMLILITSIVLLTTHSFSQDNLTYDSILNNEALTKYHGWLKYLNYKHELSVRQNGPDSEDAQSKLALLNDWIVNVGENPNILDAQTGVFEWAYLSKVDFSGQPFSIRVPTDYDPSRSYALVIKLHGRGGDHHVNSDWMSEETDRIFISILGRTRAGFYRELCETDVLEAIEYVKEYWSIDPTNVHIYGGSMGGMGTAYLTNRHPHLSASAIMLCGSGVNLPVENWEKIPFYSYHSQDDVSVPITGSRIPLRALQSINENVVIEETNGYGHGVRAYADETGFQAMEWSKSFRAPVNNTVSNIRFTALDGKACRAYWAEITEWGPRHAPASFAVEVSENNQVIVALNNVDTLKLDISQSPINTDSGSEIQFIVNGQRLAPLSLEGEDENPQIPESIFIRREEEQFVIATEPVVYPYRLHFPGGARNLYGREPVMIVWGTQGSLTENAHMETFAQNLRKYPGPYFIEGKTKNNEPTTIKEMMYSVLPGKADTEVTQEDMLRYNLVLIGNARQNMLLSRMQSSLPVSSYFQLLLADDGVFWSVDDPVTFLHYYNPLSPQRLIYNIACDNSLFYTSGHYMTERVHPEFGVYGGKDLTIYDWTTHQMIAARNFDSHWNWEEHYRTSPIITDFESSSFESIAMIEAELMRTVTQSDFSIVRWLDYGVPNRVTPGQSRIMDLFPDYYGLKIAVATLTGAEIRQYAQAAESIVEGYFRYRLSGALPLDSINDEESYSICFEPWLVDGFIENIYFAPESARYADYDMLEAIQFYLSTQE